MFGCFLLALLNDLHVFVLSVLQDFNFVGTREDQLLEARNDRNRPLNHLLLSIINLASFALGRMLIESSAQLNYFLLTDVQPLLNIRKSVIEREGGGLLAAELNLALGQRLYF